MANERRMRKMYPALYTLTLIGKASAIIGGLGGLIITIYAFTVSLWAAMSVFLITAYVVFLIWVATELIGLLVDVVYHAHNIEIATRQSEANTSWIRTKLKSRLEVVEDDSAPRQGRKAKGSAEVPSLYSE